MSEIFSYGSTGQFKVTVRKIDGTIISGLNPTCRIIRIRDGYVFDYAILQFVSIGTEINPDVPLTEEIPVNPGTYYFDFNQPIYDPSAPEGECYNVVFTGTPYPDQTNDVYQFAFVGAVSEIGGEIVSIQVIEGSIDGTFIAGDFLVNNELSGEIVSISDMAGEIVSVSNIEGSIITTQVLQGEILEVQIIGSC